MFGSVRFLVYTPTIQFVFSVFAFPFASCFFLFWCYSHHPMGVTSRCLASRDNLIKNFFIWVLREHLFSVHWLLASLCGLYCVPGLRVSSLCHIARCQRPLVTIYGFWSGGTNVFFPSLFLLDLSSSFSPSFPSGHLVSIVCLPD